jgi:hypothetical protein
MNSRRAYVVGLALMAWCACGSRAVAQVVVIRVEPAAESMCASIEGVLGAWGITQDPGYFAEAAREGLDPASDAALVRLIPALRARLAVVPLGSDEASLSIDFRDGASGSSLGGARFALLNGEVDASALREAVEQYIGPPPTAAGAEPAVTADERLAMDMRVTVGAGLGARTLLWPANGETMSVETGLFPALDVATSFRLVFSSSVAFGLDLAYQTSIGAELVENHIAGSSETLRVRAHAFGGVLALALGGPGFRVTPALGYATRGFRPEVHHLLTPSYSLAGPLARVAVRIPIASVVGLRLAPEAQYVLVGNGLEERGVASSGFALGGEVALEIAVSSALTLELCGRFTRTWLGTSEGPSATDTERFATARAVWRL